MTTKTPKFAFKAPTCELLGNINKLAKLRRHASRVHFASNSFGPIHFVLEHFRLYTLGFKHVNHHVGRGEREFPFPVIPKNGGL